MLLPSRLPTAMSRSCLRGRDDRRDQSRRGSSDRHDGKPDECVRHAHDPGEFDRPVNKPFGPDDYDHDADSETRLTVPPTDTVMARYPMVAVSI